MAHATVQAHFPSKEEVEAILVASGSLDGAAVLVTNPSFISIKREMFIYGLQNAYPMLLDIIRSLDYRRDHFPVQEVPLILSGGAATGFLTQRPLETPDLDFDLSPFDSRAARKNNDKRLVCNYDKGYVVIDSFFQEYVRYLCEQISAKLDSGLPIYEPITIADTKQDIEIINAVSEGRIAGNVYVGIIYNPSFYSKIIVMAKLGTFVERIVEIKFPRTVFGAAPESIPLDTIGLSIQNPEKMIQDNIKSMNDKLRKMNNAMMVYNTYFQQEEGEEGKQHGYWTNNIESQKREAIITYKVRIVSHVRRLQALGGFSLAMVDEGNKDLFKTIPQELVHYVTPMEREEIMRAIEAQEVEAKAADAAKQESMWEKPKKAVKGRTSPSEVVAAKPSGFSLLRYEDDDLAVIPIVAPAASNAPAVAASASAAVAAPASPVIQLVSPSHMTIFVEHPSINVADVFSELYNLLMANYSPEGKEIRVLVLQINTNERHRVNELNPPPPGMRIVIDSDRLNGAEEICFKIIPMLMQAYHEEQINIPILFSNIVERLKRISFFVINKELREKYQRTLNVWIQDAEKEGKIMKRGFQKLSFKSIFQWMQVLLNLLYIQENKTRALGYTLPPPYQYSEIEKSFTGVISFINSAPICPCEIPTQLYRNLANEIQDAYCKMKARNLIAFLEVEFTKFHQEILLLGPKVVGLSPILFLPFPTPYGGNIVTKIFEYFYNNGTNLLKRVYRQTQEFLTGPEGEEVLRVLKLPGNIDDSMQIELLMPFINRAVKDDDGKKIVCKFLLLLMSKNIIILNKDKIWEHIIKSDEEFLDTLYKSLYDSIIQTELNRLTNEFPRILDREMKQRIKAIEEKDAAEVGAALVAEFEAEAAAASAKAKTKGKKKKGGSRKTRKVKLK